jgi:glucan 1,3-beta-glucosidase
MSNHHSASAGWRPDGTAPWQQPAAAGGHTARGGATGHHGAAPGHSPHSPDTPDSPANAVSAASAGSPPGQALPPPPLPLEQRAQLDTQFRDTLARGIHGLCFSPYLEGQQPGSQIGEAQIRERLAVVQPHTRWVRSFSCTDGHEQTPRVAREMGLKTLVGAWLGTDLAINAREIEGAIAVAQAGHADIVAVGNEVLLRGDLSEDALIDHIRQVKAALPGVPVGYVDAYFLFEKHPRVTAECDVVMTNCYPFWEGCPREQALPYMQTMLSRTRAASPGKRILISETGWPDQGSAFHGAVPGTEAAMQYFVQTAAWAEAEGIEWFHFAAFDEAWKVGAEGDVGAFWGLWDSHARLKFA